MSRAQARFSLMPLGYTRSGSRLKLKHSSFSRRNKSKCIEKGEKGRTKRPKYSIKVDTPSKSTVHNLEDYLEPISAQWFQDNLPISEER